VKGVTNILLDHARASELALEHLVKQGHRRIAFIKGQEFSSDTEVRWNAILASAARLDLTIYPELTTQLRGDDPTTGFGLPRDPKAAGQTQTLYCTLQLQRHSAIGAIRALREAGLGVPEDVSVVGF